MSFALITPTLGHLTGYKEALDRGWSSDNLSTERKRLEDLSKIAEDPAAFVLSQDDSDGKIPTITLPDGSTAPRIPSFARWMWDGAFCGQIGFRWQKGTTDLPPLCLGHIGYSVVPWKQRRGYATEALRLILIEARHHLPYIDITADIENIPSQRVIIANGGVLVERFTKPVSLGGGECLRYRIKLES